MDVTRRFSDRVDDYVRYRPGYPAALYEALAANAGLRPGTRVADIGSGTGISAAPLLDRGCVVFAVEPNEHMRAAAERLLDGRSGFHSVDGRAGATGLPTGSVALVVAGQAFHWFDRDRARTEFRRILVPDGRVALFWNSRSTGGAFNRDYESLVEGVALDERYRCCRSGSEDDVVDFFSRRPLVLEFDNHQDLDLGGLVGRLSSSSYAPRPGDRTYASMIAGAEEIFARHARDGRVRFEYRTELFLGRV